MKSGAIWKLGVMIWSVITLGWGPAYRLPVISGAPVKVSMIVDAGESAGVLDHSWEEVTGSGNARLYLKEGWRERTLSHLLNVHQNLGIKMVRFHGIFGDDIGIYQGPGQYDFSKLDQIYDAILATGVKPFVELSFMPEKLASAKVYGFPFGYRPNISPPKDYEEWGKMIEAFTRHLVERYGLAEVKSWYFEVWNEPNLPPPAFWVGTMDDYFQLYDVSVKAIKSVSPELKVGGPATSQSAWIYEFLRHCQEAKVPVDFISTHGYYNENLNLLVAQMKKLDPEFKPELTGKLYYDQVRLIDQIIARFPLGKLPVFITEWNSSIAYSYQINLWPNDHDLPNDAAFMCKAVKEANGYTAGFSHWTYSDVFEEWGLPGTRWPVKSGAYHGGFGLITIDGIHKPSYHAFYFLHQLGKNLLKTEVSAGGKDIDAFATLDSGKLSVLIWYYLETVRKRETGGPEASVSLEIKNLTDSLLGKTLYGFRIDQDHGNSFPEWLKMGKPRELSEEQIRRLKQLSDDTLRAPELDQKIDSASLTMEFTMPPAGVVFLTTSP